MEIPFDFERMENDGASSESKMVYMYGEWQVQVKACFHFVLSGVGVMSLLARSF
jgi:hypothetical protein